MIRSRGVSTGNLDVMCIVPLPLSLHSTLYGLHSNSETETLVCVLIDIRVAADTCRKKGEWTSIYLHSALSVQTLFSYIKEL